MGNSLGVPENIFPSASFTDHASAVNVLAASKDNSVLATGSDDLTIRVWNTTGSEIECFGILRGHQALIKTLDIYDLYVISGSADNTIRKWDLTTCECIFVYEGHTDSIMRVMCTGEFIISSSLDHTARLWNLNADDSYSQELACIRTFKGHKKLVLPLVYIPELDTMGIDKPGICPGDLLITGSADHTARSWSLETGETVKIFSGHTGAISTMISNKEGTLLYTGSSDFTVRSWNIATGECKQQIEGPRSPVICIILFGNVLAAGYSDGSAISYIRSEGGYSYAGSFKGHQNSVLDIKFHKEKLYTASADTRVRSFDVLTQQLKKTYTGHRGAVTGMVFLKRKMFTCSNDATVRSWDLLSKKAEYLMDDEDKMEHKEAKKEEKRRLKEEAALQLQIEEENQEVENDFY